MISAKTHWLWGNMWFPPVLTVEEREVVFERPRMQGPVRECIPYERIAAVHLSQGFFTSTIAVETTGGKTHSITAIPHNEAEAAVRAIRDRISAKA